MVKMSEQDVKPERMTQMGRPRLFADDGAHAILSSTESVWLNDKTSTLLRLLRDGKVELREVPLSSLPPYRKTDTRLVPVCVILADWEVERLRGWRVSHIAAVQLANAAATGDYDIPDEGDEDDE